MRKKGMTTVVLPFGVTEIPDYAFKSCAWLTSVVLPVTVRKIGVWAFYGCTSLTAIVIPDSVTTLEVALSATAPRSRLRASPLSQRSRKIATDMAPSTARRRP